jgi:hypothetical protein
VINEDKISRFNERYGTIKSRKIRNAEREAEKSGTMKKKQKNLER